jgi:hypothetical protein
MNSQGGSASSTTLTVMGSAASRGLIRVLSSAQFSSEGRDRMQDGSVPGIEYPIQRVPARLAIGIDDLKRRQRSEDEKKVAKCTNQTKSGLDLSNAGPLGCLSHRARSATRPKLSLKALRGSGRSVG